MPPAVRAPNLFARLTQRRPRALRQQEPADMGTAFGMECSLAEQEAANDFAPSELLGE